MTRTLHDQLTAYGDSERSVRRAIDMAEIADRAESVRTVPAPAPGRRPSVRVGAVVGVSAAVAVLVVVVPWLFRAAEPDDRPASKPTVVSTTQAPDASTVDASSDGELTGIVVEGSPDPEGCKSFGGRFDVWLIRDGVRSPGAPIDYPTFGRRSEGGCLYQFDGGGEAVGPAGILVIRLMGTPQFFPKTWPHAWFSRDGLEWTVSDVPVPNRDTGLWTPIATDEGFLVVVDLDGGDPEVWRTKDGSEWARLGRFDVPADPASWTPDLTASFVSLPGEVYRDALVSVSDPILGPTPRFVTTDLGDRIQPAADIAVPSFGDLKEQAPSGMVVRDSFTLGDLDGTRGFVVAAVSGDGKPVDQICTVIVRSDASSNWSCGPDERSTRIRSVKSPEGGGHIFVYTRNSSVSVIAVSDQQGTARQWQRPFGGAVLFAFEDTATIERYQVTMFDAVGNVLESTMHTPQLDR